MASENTPFQETWGAMEEQVDSKEYRRQVSTRLSSRHSLTRLCQQRWECLVDMLSYAHIEH
jgi:hypothetical protein